MTNNFLGIGHVTALKDNDFLTISIIGKASEAPFLIGFLPASELAVRIAENLLPGDYISLRGPLANTNGQILVLAEQLRVLQRVY